MTIKGASQILSTRAFDVLEYLSVTKNPTPFRVIMIRCNLQRHSLSYYILRLKKNNFINNIQSGRSVYKITEKGMAVMRSLRDIEKELDFLGQMPMQEKG